MSSPATNFAPRPSNRLLQGGVALLLFGWFGWFFFHPINLLPADLGRHIANGRIFLTEPGNRAALLYTNFFALTNPAAPFINHHWLSGVIFYLVWRQGGFVGLGVFHLLLNLATFALVFRLAARRAGFYPAAVIAGLIIPLLAERTEVRPEIFSYLGVALFLAALYGVAEGRLKPRALWWLVPIQLLWVNLHIYFFLGPALVGLFLFLSVIKKITGPANLRRHLAYALGGVLLSSLVNPSGWQGLLYPLRIFSNYAFIVSENQSVREYFLAGRAHANLWTFTLLFLVAATGFAWVYRKTRPPLRWVDITLTISWGLWTAWAVRNLTLFGYISLLSLSALLAAARPTWGKGRKAAVLVLVGILGAAVAGGARVRTIAPATYLGLVPGGDGAARFITDHQVSGPMFNDFDIGSYAIFYLFPRLRPFADNRAEAYPASFFQETYIPLHLNDAVWKQKEEEFRFNVILYSFEDKAPWALPFIVKRLQDPTWAPVYADNFAIVFLKRNEQNTALIKQFEIPKSNFTLEAAP